MSKCSTRGTLSPLVVIVICVYFGIATDQSRVLYRDRPHHVRLQSVFVVYVRKYCVRLDIYPPLPVPDFQRKENSLLPFSTFSRSTRFSTQTRVPLPGVESVLQYTRQTCLDKLVILLPEDKLQLHGLLPEGREHR